MNSSQLQDIFQNAYDFQDWQDVLQEVFGARQLFETPRPILLPSNELATQAFELGNLTTSDDRIIGLYQIDLTDNVWLQQNKVSLRQLLRNIYKYDVDGAIVVFVQEENWRLSFISEIKVLNDEGEVIEQATEPKRFTYLLGQDEKVRTPSDRLSKLSGKTLALNDILEAFSVEALNEEFYKIIQAYFYQLVGGKIGKGKQAKNYGEGMLNLPESVNVSHQIKQEFAVRLIGRTIFCWFLKMKKPLDGESLIPESLLSSKAVKNNENYYHNILERLFFQSLNTQMDERRNDLPQGTESIPFLNGGLFEASKHDYFSINKKTGINQYADSSFIEDEWFLKLFKELEKYNFTIDENSVTEVEVSVDPEMLGRIFENLLAEIDPDSGETARKATGSFYTPREIVDYMATESLVQYIHNDTGIEHDKLRPIFKMLEQEDPEFTKTETNQILDALDKVKILDPACGSGAFPMGVLQKIVQALQKLDPDAEKWKKRQIDRITNPIVKKQLKEKLEDSGVEYARKIGVIQNSLYGVDIQPIAAEISKLRCFLSLIVDENIDDQKENRGVEPLPNLEFKFVTADTLIKLPEEKDFGGLFNSNDDVSELGKLRDEYIQSYGKRKQKIKDDFLKVQMRIAKDQGSLFGNNESKAYKLGNWNPFGYEKSDWFDPKWMFGVEKFDVVIGNPPYVQLQKEKGRLAKMYENQNFSTFKKTGDIYSLFYERGVNVLRSKGILCYITSNKWMRAGYGLETREFFAKQTNPILLIDFAGVQIFKTATVDTNILLLSKEKNQLKTKACVVKDKVLNDLSLYVRQNAHLIDFNSSQSWVILSPIEKQIKEKIERIGTPLKDWNIRINYGIKTGFNEAFIISGEKRKELIESDPKSAEIIRPILRGRDIKRYDYNFADLWLINTHNGIKEKGIPPIDVNDYPAIKDHLNQYYPRLEKRADKGDTPYNLRNCAYMEDFYKQKIAWNRIASEKQFSLIEEGIMIQDSMHFFTGDYLEFLCSILNSSLFKWLLYIIVGDAAGGNAGNSDNIKNLTIPLPHNNLLTNINRLFNNQQYKEINNIVYSIYDLTPEEIEFIEHQ